MSTPWRSVDLVVITVSLYLLFYGPVKRLADAHPDKPLLEDVLTSVYAPVLFVCHNFPSVNRALWYYSKLFPPY